MARKPAFRNTFLGQQKVEKVDMIRRNLWVDKGKWFPLATFGKSYDRFQLPERGLGCIIKEGKNYPRGMVLSRVSSSFLLREYMTPARISILYPLLLPLCVGCGVYWSSLPDLSDLPLLDLIDQALGAIGRAREILSNVSDLNVGSLHAVSTEHAPVGSESGGSESLPVGLPTYKSPQKAALLVGVLGIALLLTSTAAGVNLSAVVNIPS